MNRIEELSETLDRLEHLEEQALAKLGRIQDSIEAVEAELRRRDRPLYQQVYDWLARQGESSTKTITTSFPESSPNVIRGMLSYLKDKGLVSNPERGSWRVTWPRP